MDTTRCEPGRVNTAVLGPLLQCLVDMVKQTPVNASMRECHQVLEVYKSVPDPISETTIEQTCHTSFAGLTASADARIAACLHENGLSRKCDPSRN